MEVGPTVRWVTYVRDISSPWLLTNFTLHFLRFLHYFEDNTHYTSLLSQYTAPSVDSSTAKNSAVFPPVGVENVSDQLVSKNTCFLKYDNCEASLKSQEEICGLVMWKHVDLILLYFLWVMVDDKVQQLYSVKCLQ